MGKAFSFANCLFTIDAPGLAFDPNTLPVNTLVPVQTVAQLQTLETTLRERNEKLSELLAESSGQRAEIEALRHEVAEARRAAARLA